MTETLWDLWRKSPVSGIINNLHRIGISTNRSKNTWRTVSCGGMINLIICLPTYGEMCLMTNNSLGGTSSCSKSMTQNTLPTQQRTSLGRKSGRFQTDFHSVKVNIFILLRVIMSPAQCYSSCLCNSNGSIKSQFNWSNLLKFISTFIQLDS